VGREGKEGMEMEEHKKGREERRWWTDEGQRMTLQDKGAMIILRMLWTVQRRSGRYA